MNSLTLKLSTILGLFLFLSPTLSAQSLDLTLLKTINSQNSHAEVLWSKGLSDSGLTLMVAVPASLALYGFVAGDDTTLNSGLEIGGSVIAALAISSVMKYAINRPRPYDKYPNDIEAYRQEGSPSFPSGHTSSAFALATSLSLNYPNWYVAVPSFLWATGVGYSRMSLGVHYPSDVLCGALVGIGSAYLSHYINGLMGRPKTLSKRTKAALACYQM